QSKQQISVNLTSGVYIVHLIDSNNKKATSKVIIK
ncbi:MAG: T9SS type A sorting domain-containing protein, partial [Flavobacteriaceae bacterium]|nr:T9SS type A sorting domain-containing protein [Flavobacteriaceae bacterium]